MATVGVVVVTMVALAKVVMVVVPPDQRTHAYTRNLMFSSFLTCDFPSIHPNIGA